MSREINKIANYFRKRDTRFQERAKRTRGKMQEGLFRVSSLITVATRDVQRVQALHARRTASFSTKFARWRGWKWPCGVAGRGVLTAVPARNVGFKSPIRILTPHAKSRSSRTNAAGRARLAGDKHAKLRFLGARRAVCEQRLLVVVVVMVFRTRSPFCKWRKSNLAATRWLWKAN